MKAYIIGDEATVAPFKLTGFREIVVSTPGQMYNELAKTVRMKEVALVLVADDLASQVREKVDELRLATALPVVCEIPTWRAGRAPPVDYTKLLKKALGVSM